MRQDSGSWATPLETVVVHLRSETASLKGILASVYADALVLRDVRLLEPDQQTALDGDVAIPRDNVDFVQKVA